MVTSPNIHHVVRENICFVQIDRVDKKNALTVEMYQALRDAVQAADKDPEVACILLSAAGDCFSAGNDLDAFRKNAQATKREPSAGLQFIEQLALTDTPVVVAVQGLAVGIGTTMLLHCDFVVAASSSRFRTPFVDLGLCPEAASSLLMPLVMGARKANEMLLLGETLTAEQALSCDLVSKVVADECLQDEALVLARRLAGKHRESLRLSKFLLRRLWRPRIAETIEFEHEHFFRQLKSDTCQQVLARMQSRK